MGGEAKRRRAHVEAGGEDWGLKGFKGAGTARRAAWHEADAKAVKEAAQNASARAYAEGAAGLDVEKRAVQAAVAAANQNAALRKAGRMRPVVLPRGGQTFRARGHRG